MNRKDTLRYRAARAGEGKTLLEVTMRSARAFCGTHYGTYFIETWLAGFDSSVYEPAIAAGQLTIAERETGPVGFVQWGRGRIERLYVTQAGRGLGAALLKLGERGALEGAAALELEAALNAVGFYERHGYERLAPDVFGGRPAGMIPIPMMRMRRVQGHNAPVPAL